MKSYYQFPSVPESGIIAYLEGELIRIFFKITPFEFPDSEENEDGMSFENAPETYECEQVDVAGRTYADIVSAIVNDRYSPDDVQAILANYTEVNNTNAVAKIAVEKKDEYLNEYAAFQEWRRLAKEVAEKTIEIIA